MTSPFRLRAIPTPTIFCQPTAQLSADIGEAFYRLKNKTRLDIHIGKKNRLCPELQVHGTVMPQISEEKYLGDIISEDGKNFKNIQSRLGKGIGILSEILNILEKVTLGNSYFETAILLRESIFINGILTNSEVWYNLTKAEIKDFEDLDLLLLRRILNAPFSTPKEGLYLELGILNVETIIKARRINYLHYLTSRKKSEMLYKFFNTQWKCPVCDDWMEQVKEDLRDFNIKVDLNFIKSMSKYSFKNMVKNRSKVYDLKTFLEQKENHTKLNNLSYNKLVLQKYLKLNKLNAIVAEEVFSFRLWMAQFSEHYMGSQGQLLCPLCHTHIDNQQLSFQCPVVRKTVKIRGAWSI